MRKLIVGSQARTLGTVTEHDLRRWYDRVHRDIYAPRGHRLTLDERIDGAYLRSGRRGVVAGVAASALLGARWVDDAIPIEMIWNVSRAPAGIIVRRDRLAADEITIEDCVAVTTPARTAFDIGRCLDRHEALARLDALQRATLFRPAEVLTLAERYRGARGLKQLRALLPLVDGGAASPQETRLRLLLLDAGFPDLTTQITVVSGIRPLRKLDMVWEDYKVAAEYDGGQHQTDRYQYLKDLRVLPQVERMGWTVLRVIKEDSDAEILIRTYRALVARGWDGRLRKPHPSVAGLVARLPLSRSALALSRDNRNLAG
ncbi:hypothetical protein [Mycolicibacterium sp. P9-22]|uniref:hypothetical protein n=1 Tax=Mycolicibacterium sp. P9-22 TaxID=2024613 RepID=UPI001D156A69|nr:hypothetical protein [Mycolicibacterium sp. P9-22]